MFLRVMESLLGIHVDVSGVTLMIIAILFFPVLECSHALIWPLHCITTFLANKRGKGFISFVIFIIINWVYSYIVNLALDNVLMTGKTYLVILAVSQVIFAVSTYVGSALCWIKKISL